MRLNLNGFLTQPYYLTLNDNEQNITLINKTLVETFGYTLEDIPTLNEWWPKTYPDAEYRQWVTSTWQKRLEINRDNPVNHLNQWN